MVISSTQWRSAWNKYEISFVRIIVQDTNNGMYFNRREYNGMNASGKFQTSLHRQEQNNANDVSKRC